MHLKRVELENFKSFGRKLSIPFLDGFTAITGPNGSGKSNIGDAVLFVLGPKSNKAIRAGKLTDLIFNGGKERKPASHCQVSLVFDNVDRVIPVDADEVSLTRLVKLSKSDAENYYSYFYVNGKPSSLTEFDELLSQARISAEGYNIVRQGDILKIVEMTPLQRRAIVDEIAGITRFDADIEKADKERAEVELNLDRIRIILAEIDHQLVTLEREREAALRYKAVKDDLDLARAKHAKRRRDALEADLRNVHEMIGSETAERAALDQEWTRLAARLSDAAAALDGVERKIVERAGPEAADLKRKIDDLKRAAIQATERLNYGRDQVVELKEARGAAAADLKRQEKELAKYQKERAHLATEKTTRDEELVEADAAHERARGRIAATTGRASDLQRELAELKLRHDAAETTLHETRLALERATERRARLVATIAEQEEAQETQRFELKDVDLSLRETQQATPDASAIEALRKELFALKKQEASLSQELRELEPALRRLQTEYSRLKAEADASDQVARGYTRAVNAVLEARDQGRLRGICGTIAELATVKDKHAVAVDVAAGGRMQAIVTETDEDAAAAIEMLKRNKLGRATFLPLNKMTPGRPAGKPLMAVRAPEAEGFAIDLVKFDEAYRNAFWYVLRDTVVVKNLDAARKLMGGVRLVTLDGDLIDAGGAMTGGDRDSATSGRIKMGASQAQQFETVSKELRGAVAHQEALSSQLSQVRGELEDAERKVREGSLAADQAGSRRTTLAARKGELDARLATLVAASAEARRDLLAVEGEIREHETSVARLVADLDAMERERDDKAHVMLNASPKDLAKELETAERRASQLRERVRDLAGQLATKDHQLQLLEERRAELAARVTDLDAKLVAEEESIRTNGELAAAKEKELEVLLALDAQHNEAMRGLTQERDRLHKERVEVQAQADKTRERRNAKDDVLLSLRGRIPVIEAALVEAREEIVNLAVPPPDEVVESVEELRARVRKLEHQLEALGSVNMLALDEYDRQARRKEELVAETARLEAEREGLTRLVEEIVARKKEGFFKVFDEIAVNFSKVYERLSDGGRAELLLEDPENPFAAGLTMRAQPKGKKVTRLEALSGGEKSLTSMAFIFAIQEFDPSPFYYLDEVDQNLDGINSELLARMVKQESKHAQFIVVSLRKVTLKEAEHVYGVTMVESGLSEIVGEVRLSELADEPPRPIEEAAR